MEPRILLVEDNDFSRDMMSRRLRKRGFEILLACDGYEAIQQGLSQQPDLILMDLSLPMMDGWNASSQLKQMPETRSIPIIALTANAMQGDRERALKAGCDNYIAKPVKLDELLAMMRQYLPDSEENKQ
jgi:CheY-like chemotaxis protein